MTQLIQDVFIIENLQVLSEGKGNGKTVVKGIFGRCNETNKNGRMYPTAVLEGQLKKVQPLINERRLCGELDHPSNDTVKLANASHLITKLEMKGDELIGEAEILGTPAGLTAKALIEAGVCIGISSRGMGTLSEDANGNKVVNDDFRLVTFDLVADPSTRGAFPALAESTESRFARTSQSKLKKEQNFVTMLQEKLRESYDPWIEEAKKGKKKKAKKKGGFPDLNKDGKITKADILVGRGVIKGKKGKCKCADGTDTCPKCRKEMKMEAVKAEGSWHQIAYTLAEGLGLVEAFKRPKTRKEFSKMAVRSMRQQSLNVRSDPNNPRNKSPMEQGEQIRRVRTRLGLDHTVYQDIGMALAEGLGIVEGVDDANTATGDNSTSTSTRNLKAQTDAAKARTAAAKAERAASKERRRAEGKSIVYATKNRLARKIKDGGLKSATRRSIERDVQRATGEGDVGVAKARAAERVGLAKSDTKFNLAKERQRREAQLASHTEYKQIGFALAEAFGLTEGTIYERRKPGRTSYDEDEQDAAAKGDYGPQVQKSERATSDAGSGISRRLKSGEKPSYRGQDLTYDRTQTADSPRASRAPKGQGNIRVRGNIRKLAGPMGRLPGRRLQVSHTEYKQVGFALAEALGLIVEDPEETKVRDARRDAAGREDARRRTAHRKRTGQEPKRGSRLDRDGMPQSGTRTTKRYRDPSEPARR